MPWRAPPTRESDTLFSQNGLNRIVVGLCLETVYLVGSTSKLDPAGSQERNFKSSRNECCIMTARNLLPCSVIVKGFALSAIIVVCKRPSRCLLRTRETITNYENRHPENQ